MVCCHGSRRMKKSIVYYFISSVLISSCVYLATIVGITLPRIIRFYVNDFLIIPMVLTSILFIVRKVQSQPQKTISLLNILYLCLMYSFLFEFWLPKFHERYTYDIVDVFLYFLSGIVFYRLQKEPKNDL
jgi:hypothetical protein